MKLGYRVFAGFVWAFQPVQGFLTNLVFQIDSVLDDVSAFVVVADGALFVDVEFFESQLRMRTNRPIVAGVILPLMVTTA